MGDINYGAWPDWLEYGCRIKMRDDLAEQESTEMYGVYLPKEMMDELFGEVFELISAEEYLKLEKKDQKLCYNTAYVPRDDRAKMCVTTKANMIWWLTPCLTSRLFILHLAPRNLAPRYL